MNILITGASSGIGYSTAKAFAKEEQNKVFVLARNGEKLKELAASSGSGRIIPVVSDLTGYDYSTLLLKLEANKVEHIDILIHNAGNLINKPFEELDGSDWEDIFRTNVIGAAMLTRSLLGIMGGESHTHIVTIGSIGGVGGTSKFPGLSAYSSSKGALGILTECLAEEFKDRNMTVNCLALGAVQTEMLTKAFPGYAPKMNSEEISGYIKEFSETGWRYYNGKILQVSTTNP